MITVPDIIEAGPMAPSENFVKRVRNQRPLFVAVLGNTETAKIPGISAAGANPTITDFTPAADAEYLHYGCCKCIPGVPVTPDGIPTPAIVTKVALERAGIPFLVVAGGLRVRPQTPYVDVGGSPGGNIETGHAVQDARAVFERARLLGRQLAKVAPYLVIGESIAGGTTTALGVLTALGVDAADKMSSSMPVNPVDLKRATVAKGLAARHLQPGSLKGQPFEAVEALGDPMQPAHAGVAAGAAETVPVLLAGGTQMTAILALLKETFPQALPNVAIGTTRWILTDKATDLMGIVQQIDPALPVFAANLDFRSLQHPGLLAYEQGVVKEGVGAGGAAVSALWATPGLTAGKICQYVGESYQALLNKQRSESK